MIAIKILNNVGEKVFDTFPDDFNTSSLKESEKGITFQYLKKECDFGNFEILVKKDVDVNEERFIHSNKNFNSLVIIMEKLSSLLIKNLKNNTEEVLDEYLHNIVKIHGNQKNIVERFTYFGESKESYDEFILTVENNLKENSNQTAKDICELSKEINLMDYHIGGYRLLNDKNSEKSITKQNLKKFLLGLSHQFFNDLSKKNIFIELYRINKDIHCLFEYETFNIAMHNFLQNAVKYALPSSRINVTTNDLKRQLIFSMDSIKIERNEMSKIYEKGIFGINSPKKLRGSGIGMYTLKKALNRSGIEIFIETDHSEYKEVEGVKYERNVFRFTFPEKSYFY